MKSIFVFIPLFASVLLFANCNSNPSKSEGVYDYSAMYADSFDILIHRCNWKLTLADTLYTEMYIALKTCGKDEEHLSKKSCDIVLDRVERLLAIDTIPSNRRQYIEAKQIVYSMKNERDKFLEATFDLYLTYPENSLERLSSIAHYYLVKENTDSANYYLSMSLREANSQLASSDKEQRTLAIVTYVNTLIFQNKISEAKSFLQHQISRECDSKLKIELKSILTDFDELKKELWASVTALQ